VKEIFSIGERDFSIGERTFDLWLKKKAGGG
jgi:hypothetical protein